MKTMQEVYYDQDGINVSRGTRGDAEYLKHNMRQADRDEVWASHHLTPEQAMDFITEKTIFCLAVRLKSRPVAMFGVNGETVLGDKGIIWMLATDEISKVSFRFVRHSKKFVEMMLGFYPYVYNFVDDRNKVSIAWLRRLGAKFDTAKPHGIEQRMFRYFSFTREN
jgi:hypothetical protein